jgi:HNH endonuclease
MLRRWWYEPLEIFKYSSLKALSKLLTHLRQQQQQPQKKRKLHTCCYCGEKYQSIFPDGVEESMSDHWCGLSCIATSCAKEKGGRARGWSFKNRGDPYGSYILIHMHHISPDFPKKYVLEHRRVMEIYLDRPLAIDEVVHHIDGNKMNNRIENLRIMTRQEHANIYHPPKCRTKIIKCVHCHKDMYITSPGLQDPISVEAI